jgi:hypothetical protein
MVFKLPKITRSERPSRLAHVTACLKQKGGATTQRIYCWPLQDSIKHGLKKRTVSIWKLKDDNLDTKKYFSSIGHHDDKQKKGLLKAIKVCNLVLIGILSSSFQGYVFNLGLLLKTPPFANWKGIIFQARDKRHRRGKERCICRARFRCLTACKLKDETIVALSRDLFIVCTLLTREGTQKRWSSVRVM